MFESEDFLRPQKDELPRPLPEDYAMRGLVYAQGYHPQDWFSNDQMDEDEKFVEKGSMERLRRERILWLGLKIAASGKWLTWNPETRKFNAAEEYKMEIEGLPDIEDESYEQNLEAYQQRLRRDLPPKSPSSAQDEETEEAPEKVVPSNQSPKRTSPAKNKEKELLQDAELLPDADPLDVERPATQDTS